MAACDTFILLSYVTKGLWNIVIEWVVMFVKHVSRPLSLYLAVALFMIGIIVLFSLLFLVALIFTFCMLIFEVLI